MGNCTQAQIKQMHVPETRERSKSSNSIVFSENSLVKGPKEKDDLHRTSDTAQFAIQRRKANTNWENKARISLASDMESSGEGTQEDPLNPEKKRSTLKDVMKKLLKNKTKEDNHAMILLKECMRDKLKISLEHCENLMKSADLKDLISARDAYTGQGLFHYCCTQGHLLLFEPLLEREPNLVHCKDDDGNTPFHNLCSNTKSNEAELISMFNIMRTKDVEITVKNALGVTGLEILEKRAKEDNPYDNIKGVKLFYQHVTTLCTAKASLKEKRRSFMWAATEADRSTYSSSRSSNVLKKQNSIRKSRSKRRGLSTRTRKSKK